jgi:predicted metal-dependent peptidase
MTQPPAGPGAVEPAAARLDRARLLAARFRAAGERPYLAAALYSLTVVASDGVPTMGVDRHWRCYVSPEFVAGTPVEQLAAVWIHEVAHLLRDHHGRADALTTDRHDHHRLNIAQDCEINDDLLADGLPLPDGRVDPARLGLPEGKLFEEYVRLLPPSRTIHLAAGQLGPGQPGPGQLGPGQVDCGSGAHGLDRPWEVGVGAAARGVPVVGVGEAAAIRRQTAQALRAHVRARGDVPAGWQRWADSLLEPVVDWRRALTGAVREAAAWAAGAVDYQYKRPSRRSVALTGVVLPSLRRPVPRVAVVVDTSGSMGPDDLTAALSEVTGVLRAVGIGGNRVTVLSCDADVHVARKVASAAEVELAGGGGTDMRVGIDAALRVPDPPHVVVVLTDGYTPWPDTPLESTRVVAGLVGPDAPEPPPWIATIHIPPAAT